MFIYQPTFSMIKYHNTRTEYIISCRSKGVYITKLIPIKNDYLPNIKYIGEKRALQLNYTSLAVEQNNYTTKIVNVCVVYDLDNWPKKSPKKVYTKNCLFGATNVVKNNDKEKYVYSGYKIAFDAKGEWSFGNTPARNVIIFGVDHSSSSHNDNLKNDFLILG